MKIISGETLVRISKQVFASTIVGLVAGAAIILGVRFATYNPEHVHYHANFDVFINSQREAFKDASYYEEEGGSSCALDTTMTPVGRVHMHDNVADVVHVEDRAVTWGQFFQNLRWTITSKVIQTPEHVYLADDTHKIIFFINDVKTDDIAGTVIHDKDRLLVDFGSTSDSVLKTESKSVPATAAKYDEGKDPASCMSNAKPSLQDRLKHLL